MSQSIYSCAPPLNNGSIFSYMMRNTYDLQEELMSHGDSLEVLEPPELKILIKEKLRKALELYK